MNDLILATLPIAPLASLKAVEAATRLREQSESLQRQQAALGEEDHRLVHDGLVNAPLDQVWAAFTTKAGLESRKAPSLCPPNLCAENSVSCSFQRWPAGPE